MFKWRRVFQIIFHIYQPIIHFLSARIHNGEPKSGRYLKSMIPSTTKFKSHFLKQTWSLRFDVDLLNIGESKQKAVKREGGDDNLTY